MLCTPVSKNNGEIKDKETRLVCYSVRPGKSVSKRVEVINQFGNGALSIAVARMLCLPSLKKVPG